MMERGTWADRRLDVPERKCKCCGRPFKPTLRRRLLCSLCFSDSTKHEAHHRLATGER